jgi:histidinol-phosphate aminotransferase
VPGRQPPDGEEWVKLNTNESPLPPSPGVLEALREAIGPNLRLYPSPNSVPAREAIAAFHGLDPSQVAMGNGGDELIAMCFRAFAGAGERVAYPVPTYPLLEPSCAIHECLPAPHAFDSDWSLPASFLNDAARLKFLVNPNSPSGSWLERAPVAEAVARAQGVLVLDEAYVDFAPEPRLDLLNGSPNLLILRTLSKSHCLAGMRIGYALGHPDLIAALDLVKDSYNLDRLAIVAAVAAIGDRDHQRSVVEHVTGERAWLAARLRELAFEVPPSAANFLFVRPPAGRGAGEIFERLAERRVLVRHYDRPPIQGWFRITIGSREQHLRLLAALEEAMA